MLIIVGNISCYWYQKLLRLIRWTGELVKIKRTPDDLVLKPDEVDFFLFQPVDSCQHFKIWKNINISEFCNKHLINLFLSPSICKLQNTRPVEIKITPVHLVSKPDHLVLFLIQPVHQFIWYYFGLKSFINTLSHSRNPAIPFIPYGTVSIPPGFMNPNKSKWVISFSKLQLFNH